MEPETGGVQSDAADRSAASALFSSRGYAADTQEDLTRAATAWLEEQAIHPFIREVAVRTLARLDLVAGESVLEVGCGTGVFLPVLAELIGSEGNVVGLDHSPAFLGQASERIVAASLGGQVELVEADAARLPFDDAVFDAAHCERVLMHVEDPAQAIREMIRVVRPNGRVVVAEVFAAGATQDHPDPDVNRQIIETMVSGIRNRWMGIQLRGLFVEAGLADVDGEVVGYFESELDEDEAAEYTGVARELVAGGVLDSARAEAAVSAMQDQRSKGTHCGLAMIFVVSGRVPERFAAPSTE